MLSAFTARSIVEIKPRDKSKIESILAYGDRLLVGLNTGSLKIYQVNEIQGESSKQNGSANSDGNPASLPASSSGPPTKPVELLRELEKFSTKSIDQLAILKEANILISLSNYYISFHDLQSYTLQEQLVKTKNATTFAVTSNIVKDSATGIPELISRLAVAVKRRLLLWSWHESELSSDTHEIVLAESIRSLTWASATKIICGMNSGYVIVDVLTQDVEDIVGPGAIGGASGASSGRFGGVGSASMGYMGLGGYIPRPLSTRLAEGEMLLAKDINSLFITAEGKPIEKRQIPWAQAPDAIGYSYPYILSLQSAAKGTLEVRNPSTLSLLQSMPLPNASQLHFPSPGVSLSHAGKGFHVLSERCVWRMEATDYDSQIDELVEAGRYDEAISILTMLEDALLKNKEGRLREISMQKAQSLFSQRKYRDAVDIFMAVAAPPEKVIELYPRIISGDLAKPEDESVPEVEEIQQEEESSQTHSTTSATKPDEDRPLHGKDLINATIELSSFLVQTRTRMKRFLDAATGKIIPVAPNNTNGSSQEAFDSLLTAPASGADQDREKQLLDTAKLVDTTLFRAYMLTQPRLAVSLFRIPNFCDPDVVNEKLLENESYDELVDFFHGKKLHRPALELLKKYGATDKEDIVAPKLHGPQRTVGYLQNLPPEMIDLILEFAEWPLHADPDLGMEIFLADSENAETLPREKVVSFLHNIDIHLEIKYLEHLVNELGDMTPDFHNRLASAYLEVLKSEEDRSSKNWTELMEKYVSFLRESGQYSLGRVFSLIPREDPEFYEAQAVVLSNMDQHKQALEIYVFKIKDFKKAEEYCNRVHLIQESPQNSPVNSRRVSTSTSTSAADDTPSIYHTLLSLYLTPPAPYQPNWPPALDLLSKHGSRLPASSTLNIIPASLPIADLESYFRGRIRAANSIVSESRVVVGLRKCGVVNSQAELLLSEHGRNRRVVVGEERVCGVCHKRLGRSVIAVMPGNEVVHYGCLNRATSGQYKANGSTGWRS